MIIDAHQHFWQLSQPFDYGWLNAPQNAPIRRDFLPKDLEPLIKAAGVDRTVFVQTQHNVQENRWVLGLAEKHDFIAGVVGWVDLAGKDCERQVEEFRATRSSSGSATSCRTSPTRISWSERASCEASGCWKGTRSPSTCSFM